MTDRILDINGQHWRVRALAREVARTEADRWRWARVRFEPVSAPDALPRETWLRLEEDVPFRDVLDQYENEELEEVFLVAEEITEETEEEGDRP